MFSLSSDSTTGSDITVTVTSNDHEHMFTLTLMPSSLNLMVIIIYYCLNSFVYLLEYKGKLAIFLIDY